ncbi:hypothetical protein [Burkholderia sp. BCC1977]|nr:hypothetical protein [Burkholderia sp. BCC1977]
MSNSDFATTLTTGTKMYEHLSFRLDGNCHRYLTRYVLSKP